MFDVTPPADRKSYLLHSKILIAYSPNSEKKKGFLYSGSHNFSAAAWGRLQRDNSQLQISNYEIGVVFEFDDLSSLHLPFQLPPRAYQEGDEPWIFHKHRREAKKNCLLCGNAFPIEQLKFTKDRSTFFCFSCAKHLT
jgi:hypothetical protein